MINRLKKVTIQHRHPRHIKPYIMLPIGTYYNVAIQRLEIGDWFSIQDGYRIIIYELKRKVKVAYRNPTCAFMIQSIYGGKRTPTEMLETWKAEALINGCDISEEECLLVEVKRADIESNNIEEEDEH